MATTTAKRAERLDPRATREAKEMIETAPNLRGSSASDFVRMATREAAWKTIHDHDVLTLSEKAGFRGSTLESAQAKQGGNCAGACLKRI